MDVKSDEVEKEIGANNDEETSIHPEPPPPPPPPPIYKSKTLTILNERDYDSEISEDEESDFGFSILFEDPSQSSSSSSSQIKNKPKGNNPYGMIEQVYSARGLLVSLYRKLLINNSLNVENTPQILQLLCKFISKLCVETQVFDDHQFVLLFLQSFLKALHDNNYISKVIEKDKWNLDCLEFFNLSIVRYCMYCMGNLFLMKTEDRCQKKIEMLNLILIILEILCDGEVTKSIPKWNPSSEDFPSFSFDFKFCLRNHLKKMKNIDEKLETSNVASISDFIDEFDELSIIDANSVQHIQEICAEYLNSILAFHRITDAFQCLLDHCINENQSLEENELEQIISLSCNIFNFCSKISKYQTDINKIKGLMDSSFKLFLAINSKPQYIKNYDVLKKLEILVRNSSLDINNGRRLLAHYCRLFVANIPDYIIKNDNLLDGAIYMSIIDIFFLLLKQDDQNMISSQVAIQFKSDLLEQYFPIPTVKVSASSNFPDQHNFGNIESLLYLEHKSLGNFLETVLLLNVMNQKVETTIKCFDILVMLAQREGQKMKNMFSKSIIDMLLHLGTSTKLKLPGLIPLFSKLCTSIILHGVLDEKEKSHLLESIFDQNEILLFPSGGNEESIYLISNLIAQNTASTSTQQFIQKLWTSFLRACENLEKYDKDVYISENTLLLLEFAFFLKSIDQRKSILSSFINRLIDMSTNPTKHKKFYAQFLRLFECMLWFLENPPLTLIKYLKSKLLIRSIHTQNTFPLADHSKVDLDKKKNNYYELLEIEQLKVISFRKPILLENNTVRDIRNAMVRIFTMNQELVEDDDDVKKLDHDYLMIVALRICVNLKRDVDIKKARDEKESRIISLIDMIHCANRQNDIKTVWKFFNDNYLSPMKSMKLETIEEHMIVHLTLFLIQMISENLSPDDLEPRNQIMDFLDIILRNISIQMRTKAISEMAKSCKDRKLISLIPYITSCGLNPMKTRHLLLSVYSLSSEQIFTFCQQWMTTVDETFKTLFTPEIYSMDSDIFHVMTCHIANIPLSSQISKYAYSIISTSRASVKLLDYVLRMKLLDDARHKKIMAITVPMKNDHSFDFINAQITSIHKAICDEDNDLVHIGSMYMMFQIQCMLKEALFLLNKEDITLELLQPIIIAAQERMEEMMQKNARLARDFFLHDLESKCESYVSESWKGDISIYIQVLQNVNKNQKLSQSIISFLNKLATDEKLAKIIKSYIFSVMPSDECESLIINHLCSNEWLVSHKTFSSLLLTLVKSSDEYKKKLFEVLNHSLPFIFSQQKNISEYFNLLLTLAISLECVKQVEHSLNHSISTIIAQEIPIRLDLVNFISNITIDNLALDETHKDKFKVIPNFYRCSIENNSILERKEIETRAGIKTVNDEEIEDAAESTLLIGLLDKYRWNKDKLKAQRMFEKDQTQNLLESLLSKKQRENSVETIISLNDSFHKNLLLLLQKILTTTLQGQRLVSSKKSQSGCILSPETSIHAASTEIASKKNFFVEGSFNSKIAMERRKEQSLYADYKIKSHLLTCNYENYVVIVEQATAIIADMKQSLGDTVETSITRERLTELGKISVPYKIVHCKFNPSNDKFLAIAGIHQCQVNVLDDQGRSLQEVSIYLALEEMSEETVILDIQWIPDSQVSLAIITNEFVKVYDLSKDTFCPIFNFSAANDKIVSAHFSKLKNSNTVIMYVLTENGSIFYQEFVPTDGPCVLTSQIALPGEFLQRKGCRIYYSDHLNMLFVSFREGDSCILDIEQNACKVIQYKNITNNRHLLEQKRCIHDFCEIPDLPGVVAAITENKSILLYYFCGEDIKLQVIQTSSDMNGIVGMQSLSPTSRPSFLAMFNNGEFHKYVISNDVLPIKKLSKHDRLLKVRKRLGWMKSRSTGSESDIDKKSLKDHENITELISYGGEILNTYTNEEIKEKLKQDDNFITSSTLDGLKLSLNCSDKSKAILGIRILFGHSSQDHIPTYFQFMGQRIEVEDCTESYHDARLKIDSITDYDEISIVFGPCHVEDNPIRIDKIEVYGVEKKKVHLELERAKFGIDANQTGIQSEEMKTISLLFEAVIRYLSTSSAADKYQSFSNLVIPIISNVLFERKLNHLRPYVTLILASLADDEKTFDNALQLALTGTVEKMLDSLGKSHLDFNKFTLNLSKLIFFSPQSYKKFVLGHPKIFYTMLDIYKSGTLKISLERLITTMVQGFMIIASHAEKKARKELVAILMTFILDDHDEIPLWAMSSIASVCESCEDETFEGLYIEVIEGLSEQHWRLAKYEIRHCTNIYQLLHFLSVKYLHITKGKDNSANFIAKTLSKMFSNLLSVQNVAKRTPENDFNVITLIFIDCLLGVEIHYFRKFQHMLAKLLHEDLNIEKSFFHMVSSLLAELQKESSDESSVSAGFDSGLLVPQKEVFFGNLEPFFSAKYTNTFKSDILTHYNRVLLQSIYNIIEKMYGKTSLEENRLTNWNNILSSFILNKRSRFASQASKRLMKIMNGNTGRFYQILDSLMYLEEFEELINLDMKSVSSHHHESILKFIRKLSQALSIAELRPDNFAEYCKKHPTLLQKLFDFIFALRNEGVLYPMKLLVLGFPDKYDPNVCDQIFADWMQISRIIDKYLLNASSSTVRKEAMQLISRLYDASDSQRKNKIEELILEKIDLLPTYGIKGEQFCSLLSHVLDHLSSAEGKGLTKLLLKLLQCLENVNRIISNHPNLFIYQTLQNLIEFKGYYLESKPCLVCNDLEEPYATLSMSSIKKDVKFDHSIQLVKFDAMYQLESISVTLKNIRSLKMVKTIELYSSNRSSQLNEVKRDMSQWNKAGEYTLKKEQENLVIKFPIPITATNLMIRYSSFYEDWQNVDTVLCSICKVPVLDQQGICPYCGENAFSCPKCRNINYEKPDAFLCIHCGHCKYASFEYTLSAKKSFMSEKIKSQADQEKALAKMETHLQNCHSQFNKLKEYRLVILKLINSFTQGTASITSNKINNSITTLAKFYSNEAKSAFDLMSSNVKALLHLRREIIRFIEETVGEKQEASSLTTKMEKVEKMESFCFGCANHFIKLCLEVFHTVMTKKESRTQLSSLRMPNSSSNASQYLMTQLFSYNIRYGQNITRKLTRKILCDMAKDDMDATLFLLSLVNQKIQFFINKHHAINITNHVDSDMNLVSDLVLVDDTLWEERLRLVIKILASTIKLGSQNLEVAEQIVLPCIKILSRFSGWFCSDLVTTKRKIRGVMHTEWLSSNITYEQWKRINIDMGAISPQVSKDKQSDNSLFSDKKIESDNALLRIYFHCWKRAVHNRANSSKQSQFDLIRCLLLHGTSQSIRHEMASILKSLTQMNYESLLSIVKILTAMLPKAVKASESAKQFFSLYSELIELPETKYYLVIKGFMNLLPKIILKEAEAIKDLEEKKSYYSIDLNQGFVLSYLVDVLVSFIELPGVSKTFKRNESNIDCILLAFLHLRKLIIQKTKLTDNSCQSLTKIINQLKETEHDKKLFMASFIKALKSFKGRRSATYIFEELNNLICPIKETPTYHMNLKNAENQQFYFTGSMTANPYSTSEFKLMIDVKEKICKELDIDSGFQLELLVNNKIINLNLPVVQVFEKVWKISNPATPMEVIYRFQGLDGEATEDVIDQLDNDEDDNNLDDRVRITSVVSRLGGFEDIMQILNAISDFSTEKKLSHLLLQFLLYCVKLKVNRRALVVSNAVEVLLSKCKPIFSTSELSDLAEMLLLVIKSIVLEATAMSRENMSPKSPMSPSSDSPNMQLLGKYEMNIHDSMHQLKMFLDRLPRCSPKIVDAVAAVLPFITYGLEETMNYLVDFFVPHLDYVSFDKQGKKAEVDYPFYLNVLSKLVNSIPNDIPGNNLKSLMMEKGITKGIVNHFLTLFLDDFAAALRAHSTPYILQMMKGLFPGHVPTQNFMCSQEEFLNLLHKIEENTEEKQVASFADALLTTIVNESSEMNIITKVNELRNMTKNKKKQKAMSKREQVMKSFLHPQVNESLLEDLEEETGLKCCICEEGYTIKPDSILCIYTYCKAIHLNGTVLANSNPSNPGLPCYSTVTHFNIIHLECHNSAAIQDKKRQKSEWEGAEIRNQYTKCNNLIPIKGPKITEKAYKQVVEKYLNGLNRVQSKSKQHWFKYIVHDLQSLLSKFALEQSFSTDSGGGTAIHNIALIPFIFQLGLYILDDYSNCKRSEFEDQYYSILNSSPPDVNTSEIDGEISMEYGLALSLFVCSLDDWELQKNTLLIKLVKQAVKSAKDIPTDIPTITTTSPSSSTSIVDYTKDYFKLCKPALIYFSLIDEIHKTLKCFATSNISHLLLDLNAIPSSFEVRRYEKNVKWITDLKHYLSHQDIDIVELFQQNVISLYEKMKKTVQLQDIFDVCKIAWDMNK